MSLFTKERRKERAKFYHTKTWRLIRAKQLKKNPLCENCLLMKQTTPATVCDHQDPYWSTWKQFIKGPFNSLCHACHQLKTSLVDMQGYEKKRENRNKS